MWSHGCASRECIYRFNSLFICPFKLHRQERASELTTNARLEIVYFIMCVLFDLSIHKSLNSIKMVLAHRACIVSKPDTQKKWEKSFNDIRLYTYTRTANGKMSNEFRALIESITIYLLLFCCCRFNGRTENVPIEQFSKKYSQTWSN